MITIVIIVVLTLISFTALVAAYQKSTNAVCESKRRLEGKTAVVTGGTGGMGLEVARDLAERGARVLIACPFPEEGARAERLLRDLTGNNNIEFKLLDLASLASTRHFAGDILKNEDRLDILVNNAGVGAPHAMSKDNFHSIMQVNYFGAYLLTLLLLPLLKKTGKPGDPSRIVNVASMLHINGKVDIDNLNNFNSFLPLKPYSCSKLCLVLFGHELAKRMAGWNVVVNSVDPGAVGTNIFSGWNRYIGFLISFIFCLLFKTSKQGAQTSIYVAVDKKAGEVSGRYFKNCRESRAAKKGRDDKMAKKLWEESARLVQLSVEEQDKCFKVL